MAKVLRWIIVAGLSVTLLVVAAAGLAYWLLDLDTLVAQQLEKQKPTIEQAIGREVTWGPISTSFLPTLGGRVEALQVGPSKVRTDDTAPLLKLQAVKFEIGLWRALTSLGKQVEIQLVALDGFEVRVVRYADGTLSYQDILDHRAKLAAAEPPPPAEAPEKAGPIDPKVLAYLQGVSVGELRIADGRVVLVDHMTADGTVAENHVSKLDLRVRDVRLADPIKVAISAAVFTEQPNFGFNVTVGPLPQDLVFAGLPAISDIALDVKALDLSKLTPYLGKSLPVRIESATLDADVKVPKLTLDGPMRIDAAIGVAKLRVAGGQVFDFDLATNLDLDLARFSVDLAKLQLGVGDVKLSASGKLRELTTQPRFDNFRLQSTTLNPERLLAYYPPARKGLPAGTRVDGNIVVDLTASGDASRQALKGTVDLAALDLAYPGAIEKPRGTAMGLSVDGTFTSDDADLKRLGLVLDVLDLALTGTVKKFSDPAFDLTLAAQPFAFDKLVRLVPGMTRKLAAKGIEAKGNGRIDGHVKGTMKSLDALLDVALTQLDLDVPGTTLKGDVTLHAEAKGDPKASLAAALTLDADKATLVVPETLNKPANVPLHADVKVTRNGDRIDIGAFDLQLANLSLAANGSLDLAAGRTDVKVDLKPFDLAPLIKVVPALDTDYTKNGRIDAKIEVSGDPNDLSRLAVTLPTLNMKLGRSDFRGQFAVTNLATLAMTGDLTSNLVDADELYFDLPDDPEPAADPAAPPPEPTDNLARRRFDMQFKLQAKTLRAYKRDFEDFRGRLRIRDGVLYVDESSFRMFGGTIDAAGTEITFWRAKKPFKANLTVQQVSVDAALASFTKYAKVLDGKGDFALKLDGRGFALKDLEEALSGEIDLSMVAGRLLKMDLLKSITAPLASLQQLPGVKSQAVSEPAAFKELKASVVVKDGQLQLTKPVALSVGGQMLNLQGGIGIAGTLAMKGDYPLAPDVVKQMTGGKCVPTAPMPVPITIGGSVTEPDVKPDLTLVAKTLFDVCVKGAALSELQKQTGIDAAKLADDAKAKAAEAQRIAKEAEEKARAEADRIKAEAEAKARAEADRLKAEGERLKAEAEAKARAEAARLKAELEAKARAEADRLKKEAEAKAKAALAAQKKKLEEEAKKKALDIFAPKK